MKLKNISFMVISMLLVMVLLAGCGEKGDPLIRVGIQGTKDTVEFDENKVIEDQAAVKEFKSIIADAHTEANAASVQEAEIDKPYIAIIDNRDGKSLTVWLNLWLQRDGSVLFNKKRSGDSRYFLLDHKAGARVKQLLALKR
ncbi:hypothetical protein B9G55_13275 [Saccharibacillus sp. O16]|nr:hypothetical protein B9G55_13275 [Saccharibacillus sp. O16]